ncbi:uncharacterized protein LOC114534837 [Dendronephthya gigantea]|uniref:uncharacterized protein LOC114534837 n=1 Tax=Dendronephthya gigantea TaxID=151771 RepID=UPI00106B3D89|nr:uncharacterized protein LOC114534837 [Dendronephthya gigantea]
MHGKDNVMLWAAFTLAFFRFLRCSEFTCNSPFEPECHLSRNDIIFHPNILHSEYYDVLIKRSKTDPFRRGCRQGLAEKLYASHSFRIGAATAAGSVGLTSWLIKTLGRWSSDCYERYIRTPKEVLASVPYKLTASTKH